MIDWNSTSYHGRYNKYPFTEVVAFVMRKFGGAQDRSKIRILDLGYGGAHHLMFLAQEGFQYYGIDGANEALEIATRRLEGAGFSTNTLCVGTFEKLPYENDFFDCVIDRGSITCNPCTAIRPLLDECRRVLKIGGCLFSMILNDETSSRNDARSLGNGDYTDFPGRLQGAGVLHFTNATEAKELFSGFNIQDIELSVTRSEYPDSGNSNVTAWSIVTCTK